MSFIIHDSTLNGINPKRLGHSYGLYVFKENAYVIDDIEKAVDNLSEKVKKSPDAVLLHVGINDIKKKDAMSASKAIINSAHNISRKHPDTKIIISTIAPTRDKQTESNRRIFNSSILSESYNNDNIFTTQHENLKTNNIYIKNDNIHPTQRGSSVLAGNVGRSLRNFFWIKPRRRQTLRPSRPRRYNFRDMPYHDGHREMNPINHHHRMSAKNHFSRLNNDRQLSSWWNSYNTLYQY